jgi:hypothetical protein
MRQRRDAFKISESRTATVGRLRPKNDSEQPVLLRRLVQRFPRPRAIGGGPGRVAAGNHDGCVCGFPFARTATARKSPFRTSRKLGDGHRHRRLRVDGMRLTCVPGPIRSEVARPG